MKYVLICISSKYTNEMSANDLVAKIATKIDIERLNMGWGDGVCLLVLETKTKFNNLKKDISEIMNKECPMFFLYKNDTKSSLTSLPDSYQHILNLDDFTNVDFSLKNEIKQLLDILYDFTINEDDFTCVDLLNEPNKQISPPTIDDLLDKICESGYNSLSLYEKETLNTYSKNLSNI